MPQKETFGVGSLEQLKAILQEEDVRTVFLVTGKKSYETCGAKAKIDTLTQKLNVIHFFDFETNPKIEDIARGIELFNQSSADLIIAVGGGSAIDMAKAINCLAHHPSENLITAVKNKDFKKSVPLIAIPTTSGTGSEATRYSVVYINKVKHSVAPLWNVPDYAIIDPSLTFNLPPRVTAATGIDALAQAIESYWCVYSTDESKALAAQAIALILEHLENAVKEGNEPSRTAMSKGANLAGKAIEITRTTAPHAVSYPFTAHFGIPHGHAVGLTLGKMLAYNAQVSDADCLDTRGAVYVQKTIDEITQLLGANNPQAASQKLYNLMESIGLPWHLSDLGLTKADFQTIIENGFNPERVKNNPRQLTKDALKTMLDKLF